MKRMITLMLATLLSAGVWAKLPEPSAEQQAAAAEKKIKADEAKVKSDALLAATQDRVAERYKAMMQAK
ncbi:MAG: hypothetical protein KKD25_13695 [Gammaproteobacteria bacterium]|jgi:hypothetical protein|nr:hypothetical protein [Gammaproteobacteria bacterium]MBU0772186.1 hypothetical protein [Gammaproteobacteria bacterium]MBU0856605.1 hypothetical protein [Gammaproteobacteria bacterium]MBU1847677.1 hypothetical protein [Gammaproteobacteria bacterium]